MEIITVIIADDHVIFRKGVLALLNEISEVKVIGEASNGNELLAMMKKQPADVVLMDIKMPHMDGIEATKRVKEQYPGSQVIALTMHEEISYFNRMLEVGASGFLLKKTNQEELRKAIKAVFLGEQYFAEEFAATIKPVEPAATPKTDVVLTQREKEVLEMICKGKSNAEISKILGLSPRTIDGHRAHLLEKTGAKNAANLVMYAVKNGLI